MQVKGLNVQYSMIITPPNLHIASLLAIQNKTKNEMQLVFVSISRTSIIATPYF
jgi:hypothetical protein